MGLLSKIVGKVAPFASTFGGFIPGVGPLVAKAGALLSKVPLKSVGKVVAAGGAFGAAETLGGRVFGGGGYPTGAMAPAVAGMGGRVCIIGPDGHKYAQSRPRAASAGGRWYRCRPRGRGLTARDIRGCQKVARVVSYFGYKPKFKHHKRRR